MSERRMLPARRATEHLKFRWKDHSLFLSCSYYDNGDLGEVFLSAGKLTSAMDIAAKDTAIAISVALQHGTPVQTLYEAFLKDASGNPEGLAAAAMQALLKEGMDRGPAWRTQPPTEPVAEALELPPPATPNDDQRAALAALDQIGLNNGGA